MIMTFKKMHQLKLYFSQLNQALNRNKSVLVVLKNLAPNNYIYYDTGNQNLRVSDQSDTPTGTNLQCKSIIYL